MGLDMYLTKKIYIGATYDHRQITGQVIIKKEGVRIPINFRNITYIEEEVGYWRKANHIHKWFVDNVQDGNDDCREYYVTREKLVDLYNTCDKVLKDHSLASELLPSQSGFFFGGTDYDTYYYEQVEATKKILKPLIESEENVDVSIYYQSSW